MRYFTLLDFQHWALAFCLGLFSVIVVYIAWHGYQRRRFEDLDVTDRTKPTEVPGSEHNAIAPILVFVYIGILLWIFFYVVLVGLGGGQMI